MEDRAQYTTGRPQLRPATLLRFNDPQFQHPDWQDARALKEISGRTGSELATIVGVDARTWRKWTAPATASQRQAIPYAAWRLLLIELGVIEQEGHR